MEEKEAMKNKVVRKLLMVGLSSSVVLTSTVGVTAASMDATTTDVVVENAAEDEVLTPVEGEEAVTEETSEEVAEEETTEETIAETETAVETESVVESESESPVLTMKAGEASIAVGTQFIYQNHIESIVDNKDQEMDLFREVVIEGDYDCNTPGTYSLVFYTYDSDNNRSNEVPFTLIVQ